jgi:hypothetical protein
VEDGIDATMHLVANHQIQGEKKKEKTKQALGRMPSCLQLLGQWPDM